MRALVELDADITNDATGATPLYVAALQGYLAIVQILEDAGALCEDR